MGKQSAWASRAHWWAEPGGGQSVGFFTATRKAPFRLVGDERKAPSRLMRTLSWLVMVLLVLLAGAFAALTLGTFASLMSDSPLWLRSLGSVEAALSGALGTAGVPGFTRALGLAVLSSGLLALAAYLKPR